jgi:hypothetical protein
MSRSQRYQPIVIPCRRQIRPTKTIRWGNRIPVPSDGLNTLRGLCAADGSVQGARRGGVPAIAGDQTGDSVKRSPLRQCHRGIVILRGTVAPWCDAAPSIKLTGSRSHSRRDTKPSIDLGFMMLRFLFRLTISLSSGAALTVLLFVLVTYFFPEPTGIKRQASQLGPSAKVLMRSTAQKEPIGRPTQAPGDTQKVSEQTTSPAADIRSLPPSEGIPGPSVEHDMGVRSDAHASEQQRQLASVLMPETSPERARVLPVSVAIDNRNAQDQELPQVAPGALSEQNELADATRASFISPSSSYRSVTSQNDNFTVAASAADDDTKIEPVGQAPSGAPKQQDRPAATDSSARGSEQQQSATQENLNRNNLSVAEHISIHYRRDSSPARADAQRLASWLVSSGFATPRLLTTGHDVASPVVRYFFKEDAEGVALLVRALRSRDGSWRAEDCRSYRHKPPAGTIEVWPHA